MTERPTFASVTDIPCTCDYLQDAADDPSRHIVFDKKTGEFHFQSFLPGSAAPCITVIYHCPFCGGAAPPSRRDLLFANISAEEEDRLAKLLSPVNSIESALQLLGKPDEDEPDGTATHSRVKDGKPSVIQHHRTLIYENLSPTATVRITESPNGAASWQLQGKYIGAPTTQG